MRREPMTVEQVVALAKRHGEIQTNPMKYRKWRGLIVTRDTPVETITLKTEHVQEPVVIRTLCPICMKVHDAARHCLAEENDRLRAALEFYAPEARYDKQDGWIAMDRGATARAALNYEEATHA